MKKAIILIMFMLIGCQVSGCSKPQPEGITTESSVSEVVPVEMPEPERFEFASMDLDGNIVDSDSLKDKKLIMVNIWEPWCGPCVSEMPALVELYEKYRDKGFIILGAFSTTDMKDVAVQIAQDLNVSYPIIFVDDNIATQMTNYVPTTFFINGEGIMLSEEPYIGSNTFDGWEETILQYLD